MKHGVSWQVLESRMGFVAWVLFFFVTVMSDNARKIKLSQYRMMTQL